MTVNELYRKFGKLIQDGKGDCNVDMEIPDGTSCDGVSTYSIDDVEVFGNFITLVSIE
jgi:hypothetical protein